MKISANRTKRRTVLLFALSLLTLTAVFSCAESKKETDTKADTETVNTADTQGEEAPSDSLEARKKVSDGVPDLDFEGADYRIYYQKRYTTDAIPLTDSETGDVLNDAVYRRNKTIEERFNVNIVGMEGEEEQMVTNMINTVAAGDDAWELFMGHSMSSGRAALDGYFYNWYDIPYMDFSKPWFPRATIEGLTINDRMYMTVSDMCLSFVFNTYCMFFNKQLAADHDIDDVYAMVNDGAWTLDKLSSITKGMYQDLNGSGTKDTGDLYGFGSASWGLPSWIYACDVDTVEFHDDGTVTSVFNSERASHMVEQLRTLYYQNEGSYSAAKDVTDSDPMQAFKDGQVLFITEVVGASEKEFRDVTFDYGIIPYPKYDEAQTAYYNVPGGSISCMAVPASTGNLELAGAVTAALCRESWVNVMPVYYDIVLKVKGARDEVSIEMLDMIMNGRNVDARFLYDGWNGYTYTITEIISGKKELSSYIASKEKSVIKHYEKVLELFYKED
ncbi:MAG: extracellular solute-binding protein [Clostridia bacterium]|nr:extracellular solute-binding protein [Clostridia bacterium]